MKVRDNYTIFKQFVLQTISSEDIARNVARLSNIEKEPYPQTNLPLSSEVIEGRTSGQSVSLVYSAIDVATVRQREIAILATAREMERDLVAATHGRSFWILDDVTALRGLAKGSKSTCLFAPRTAIRTKLHWSAGANVRQGIAYGPAFGIDGSTVMVEREDGSRFREHLDVGENPPNGAVIWYWLKDDPKGPVTLTFREAGARGRKIVSFSSADKDAAPARTAPAHFRGCSWCRPCSGWRSRSSVW